MLVPAVIHLLSFFSHLKTIDLDKEYLESVEVEDEVQSIIVAVKIIAAVVGGCATLQSLLQAVTKHGQIPHGHQI